MNLRNIICLKLPAAQKWYMHYLHRIIQRKIIQTGNTLVYYNNIIIARNSFLSIKISIKAVLLFSHV